MFSDKFSTSPDKCFSCFLCWISFFLLRTLIMLTSDSFWILTYEDCNDGRKVTCKDSLYDSRQDTCTCRIDWLESMFHMTSAFPRQNWSVICYKLQARFLCEEISLLSRSFAFLLLFLLCFLPLLSFLFTQTTIFQWINVEQKPAATFPEAMFSNTFPWYFFLSELCEKYKTHLNVQNDWRHKRKKRIKTSHSWNSNERAWNAAHASSLNKMFFYFKYVWKLSHFLFFHFFSHSLCSFSLAFRIFP